MNAIDPSEGCDYRATLMPDAHGDYGGRAESFHEVRGAKSGLAGRRPRVRVVREIVQVYSRWFERRPPRWLCVCVDIFLVLMPFGTWLGNRWSNCQEQMASRRSFALDVPGISKYLRTGVTIRVVHKIEYDVKRLPAGRKVHWSIPTKATTYVTVLNGDHPVASWGATDGLTWLWGERGS